MVNYACAFSQSESGKCFERIISYSIGRTEISVLAGLHVTSRRPCWWSRTKTFLSSGNSISRSNQSMKIGTDLSIEKSKKIGKSDLIDIDCIDQSVEIDDTLVSFFNLS